MPKIRHATEADPEQFENLARHWWRVAFVAAALTMAFFLADEPWVALFAALPILLWCTGPVRSDRDGVVVGLILLALLAWFTTGSWLGWSGRWVPSVDEALWLHTPLATLVYGIGAPATRRLSGFLPLVLLLPVGLVLTGYALTVRTEGGQLGDEGVLPAPAGLSVVELPGECASGGCARQVRLTGDDPAEVMRAHLAGRGFTPTPTGWRCRLTGLVIPARRAWGWPRSRPARSGFPGT